MSAGVIPLSLFNIFLYMNYVWPEFSRMRYVDGICQPRSLLYPFLIFTFVMNYGWPEFSWMRYVGGLRQPWSLLYSLLMFTFVFELRSTWVLKNEIRRRPYVLSFFLWKFLSIVKLCGGFSFDLISASIGYEGATTVRSYLL